MPPEEHLVTALRALCEREGGHTAVALEARVSADNLWQILNGTKLPSGIPRGVGRVLRAKLEARFPGWTEAQHSPRGIAPTARPLAQVLSHPIVSDGIPLMPWETIVKGKVPPLFRAVLPDDAMAPEFPKGTEVVWSIRQRMLPGRMVLVRDRHGQVHARECRQGMAPGQWSAVPRNAAYVAIPGADVELVAVFRGRLEPEDE